MNLGCSISRRFRFWREAIRHTWGLPLVIIVAIWGLASFLRDELVPDDIQTRYQLLDFLPSWSAAAWGLFISLLLLIVFTEAGYRIGKKRQGEIDQLNTRITDLLTPEITLLYREGDTRYLYMDHHRQVVAVCLFNGSVKTIDNMEIYSNGVIPTRLGQHNLILRPRVSSPPMRMSPGEEHFVPIIWFSNGEFETIQYTAGATTIMQGEEFLIKVVVVGRDMQAARKMLRFGIKNNEIYAVVADNSGDN